jgi:hypothetical protein
MVTTIDELPPGEINEIKARLITKIQAMDEAEIKTMTRTKESIGSYIADAARSIAKVLGYVIALPVAWAMRFAESIAHGFGSGWISAFKSAGY